MRWSAVAAVLLAAWLPHACEGAQVGSDAGVKPVVVVGGGARTRIPSKDAPAKNAKPAAAAAAAAAARDHPSLNRALAAAHINAAAKPADAQMPKPAERVKEEATRVQSAAAKATHAPVPRAAGNASKNATESGRKASTQPPTEPPSTPAPFLYAGSPVVALTEAGFTGQRLAGALALSRLVFVIFYSSSCGHCIQHAPTWKRVAQTFSSPPKLVVAALDCDAHRDTCTAFNVSGTPFIRAFVRGVPDDGPGLSQDYEYFVASVRLRFAAVPATEAKQTNVIPTLHPHEKRRRKSSLAPKQRIIADAATAVRYGLNVGVFLGRSTVRGAVLEAHTFPTRVGRWKLQWLHAQLATRTQLAGGVLDSGVFDQVLEGWDFANTRGEPIVWQHCQGLEGEEAGGGFSCAQWLLFHLVAQRAADLPAGVDAAATIHGFVQHFFGCLECRDNFLRKNPAPPELPRGDAAALATWLWREHNAVSARLNVERAEDRALSNAAAAGAAHYHAKVPFPPLDACEACYDKDGAVVESAVARYLAFAYGFDEAPSEGEPKGSALGALGWMAWLAFFSALAWAAVGGLLRKKRKREGKWM